VRGASDKETRSRLPDRPVVLRQWSQPTLGANTKEYVRDRPVNLSCLSHPTPPASRAHGDEPTGFNMESVRVCARARARSTCHSRSSHCSCRSTTVESVCIAADLSPDAVLTALFADTRGFPDASVGDRSVCEFLGMVEYC